MDNIRLIRGPAVGLRLSMYIESSSWALYTSKLIVVWGVGWFGCVTSPWSVLPCIVSAPLRCAAGAVFCYLGLFNAQFQWCC